MDTKSAILDAAEQAFAEHGFEAASLRSIIATAKVNVAAIHYHFGSKEALIEAVFERRLKPVNSRRLALLDAAEARAGSAPAPLVGLDAGLSGLNFGLPQFDASELGQGNDLLGEGGDVVMTDDTVDVAPRPLLQTPMTYPPRARAQGVTGYVVLSLLIGPTGQVERVRVLEAQPAGVFDDVAVAGVQGWRFEPATYRGENVRVWATQRVRFDLS